MGNGPTDLSEDTCEVRYRIEYSPDAEEQLRALPAHQHAVVVDGIERQLAHQPTLETRNRKPMRPNPIAPWEPRIGLLRVYDDVEMVPHATVYIRAIGVKERNRILIGNEVVRL